MALILILTVTLTIDQQLQGMRNRLLAHLITVTLKHPCLGLRSAGLGPTEAHSAHRLCR
jgi:hypothetical protein